jgi:hypothetical protein
LQTVWESPEVDMCLKKRIVRTLIEIIVDVDNDACEVIVIGSGIGDVFKLGYSVHGVKNSRKHAPDYWRP